MSTALEPAPTTLVPERMTFRSFLQELKPRGRILTPFNVISVVIMVVGAALLVLRFARGLGATTNLSQDTPWGLWIGFDVVTGVALAGGAYVVTFMVYILKMEKFRPIVRATVLNGFLAYVFYAGALAIDVGRPWKMVNPIIGNSFGVSSVLFLVAWHFLLYMLAMLIEFSPTVAEWMGLRRARRLLAAGTLGAVIFGITLSTLHQSGLGALYLMAKPKIHPLWWSEFIPILFFVSSIFAGLSMVILEGSLSHRVFHHRVSRKGRLSHDGILVSLARICAGVMFAYFTLQVLTFVHGQNWSRLGDAWGRWYLVEVVGFVLFPLALFARGAARRHLPSIRLGAGLALLGIILNRLNVTVIAFNWYDSARYFPSWMEYVVTAAIICAEIWVFRWVINRMPVLSESPAWVREEETTAREPTADAA